LLAGAMQTRSNRVFTQFTRDRELTVTEASNFSQQEDVPIHGCESFERLSKHGAGFLRRRHGRIGQFDAGTPTSVITEVIERQVSRNPVYPRSARAGITVWHRPTGDAKEDLLGEFPGVWRADDPAEVTENSVSMRGKEDFGVRHDATLSFKNTWAAGSSQNKSG
jgi:hypothetical protein